MDMLDVFTELVEKEVARQLSAGDLGGFATIRFGTVTDAVGRPKVQFDGEAAASGRRYPYLSSYTPTISDRVMLVRSRPGSWVVVGKII